MIRRIIRRDSAEHQSYLDARFNDKDSSTKSFLFDGHRWAYSYSSFDDDGEYDVITRPGEKGGDQIRDVQRKALRDQFAMAAMQGDWAAEKGTSAIVRVRGDLWLAASLYYRMADAMLDARKEKK
jgi:hypothetical protein